MSEKQETTYPQLTPKDFTDTTVHRVNSLVRDLYEKVATADTKADDALTEARRTSAAVASDNRTFDPPTVPPADPTNVVVTVPSGGDQFKLIGTWDKPADTSGTTGYEWGAQYWQDAGLTTPDSDFIALGVVFDQDTVTAETQLFRRPTDADKYVKIAVRGVGSDNTVGNWVWSATAALVEYIVGGGGPELTPPTQPTGTDWDLPTPSGSDYRADKVGNQFVRLRPSLVAMPTDADFVEFWLYKSGTAPTDLSLWEYIGTAQAAGEECENWQPQPTAGETWIVCATSSKKTYRVLPDAVSSAKTVSIAAWTQVLQLLTASLTLEPFDYQGQGRYRIKVVFTRDTSDYNFQAARADMNWCDNTFTPITGSDGQFKNVAGSYTSPFWIGGEVGFDLPSPVDGTQYRQVMVYPIGHDNQPNLSGAFVFNTTLSPDGGFNAAAIDPTTLGGGLYINPGNKLAVQVGAGITIDNANQLANLVRSELLNSDFEFGLDGWSVSGDAAKTTADTTTPYTGTYSVKILPDGANFNGPRQTIPWLPNQTAKVATWVKHNLNGTPQMIVRFHKKDGTFSDTYGTATADNAWRQITVTAKAPADTVSLEVYPFLAWSNSTTGSAYVDLVTIVQVSVDLGFAEGFDSNEFEISGVTFKAKVIAAEKIYVGSTLRVGGGSGAYAATFGGNANGQIAVYDFTNALVGWVGTNGGYYGGWFKQLYVGGSGPSTAKIYADTSGNTYIVGTTFVLDLGGVRASIENTYDSAYGAYAGVIVKQSSGVQRTILTAGGMAAINSLGYINVEFSANGTTGGSGAIRNVTGTTVIAFYGNTGRIHTLGGLYNTSSESLVQPYKYPGWDAPAAADIRVGSVNPLAIGYVDLAKTVNGLIASLRYHGLIGD